MPNAGNKAPSYRAMLILVTMSALFSLLAQIFHEPILAEVKRLQVLRGSIFGLPLRRFEAICEFCRHRPQTPG